MEQQTTEKQSFQKINKAYNSIFQPSELTFGIFFPIESYSGSIPAMQNQVTLAARAEELGFAALWFRDVPLHVPSFGDVGQIYDPFTYMGYIAAQTKNIALATGSIILPVRHPVHVAKSAASIDHLTNGRIVLGVASGDRPQEYPAFNKSLENRSHLFRESFHFINKISESFPTIYSELGIMSGETDLLPKPAGTKIPMLVTGHSGQSLEWIAKNSDGWLYYPRGIQNQETIIEEWRRALQNTNEPAKPFAQSFYLDLSEDMDESPRAIHLGYRVGRNYLIEIFQRLKQIGVNHIAINLKYGKRPAAEVLEELGEYILPAF